MSRTRTGGVWAYTGLLTVIAAAGYYALVRPIIDADQQPPATALRTLAFAAAFLFAERFVVRVRLGKDAIALSLMEIPLVLGLYFLRPDMLLVARLSGSAVTFLLEKRAFQKSVFNVAMFAVETVAAVSIWHAVLHGHKKLGPWGWLATASAATATSLMGALLVMVVITIASGKRPRLRGEVFSVSQAGDLANACAALVAVYIVTVDWRAAWLLAVLTGVLWMAHRSYERARRRNESLEQVNKFTETVGREIGLENVIAQVLLGIKGAFPAAQAELRLVRGGSDTEDWVVIRDEVLRKPAWLISALGASGTSEARLLGPKREGTELLESLGLREALVAPLRSEGAVVGCLAVADKIGHAAAFSAEDLRQLQALANHAAVAIDNALRADLILRQSAEREHAAMHDELTGLPNRRLFTRHLGDALNRGKASVLLLDLDNFRAVNDTLGHIVGDRLLKLISERVREATPRDASLARLGGDEFAVLLPGANDLDARSAASVLRSALTRTFDLDGLGVAVDPSVGVVVADPGDDAATVLRHADLALSSAQENRTGYVVFTPELDRSDSSRLGLLADLRSAIVGNDLAVHYQPQIEMQSGDVRGVEALARWWHPEHGAISPEEFIPLAEHSGLITPLTMAVLRTALQDTERFQRVPGDFGVAVNISPRSLLDRGFVDDVARELDAASVPASALTLEITETSLMTDPEQAVRALERLRAIGVRLSVDDLGTGYSSLSYLLRLPVDEVKIDRAFITTLPDPAAASVVSAIVDLGHGLGRTVVAEGIEDAHAFELLRQMRCDSAQGFWMGRPMPVRQLTSFLNEHRGEPQVRLRRVR